MYQVLFAEDELLVRLGLQNSIPWERFDMEMAAQAADGITAFELYRKLLPDVVITDIRMEGMDGIQLIKKIREEDRECAIIVISCLDDFEILRQLIPYDIIGYILKVSMDMEEIFGILEKARVHLVKVGRISTREVPEELPEKKFARYLTGDLREAAEVMLCESEQWTELVLLTMDEIFRDKINELAVTLLAELIRKQIPAALIVETGPRSFCLILKQHYEDLEDRIKRVNLSADSFLDVYFQTAVGARRKNETLKECYRRLLKQKAQLREEEKSWDNLIQKATQYIREHYQDSLNLSEIAKISGVSPSYFSYLFKRETGKNYIEYLNEIRLEKVVKELRTSSQKIAVIAANNGFHNFEHFSRYFKKCLGVSPAKWREQNR